MLSASIRTSIVVVGTETRERNMNRTALIEIRTSDTAWQARHVAGRDGRWVTQVTIVDESTVKATGRKVVHYEHSDMPKDRPNRFGFVPAEWVVG